MEMLAIQESIFTLHCNLPREGTADNTVNTIVALRAGFHDNKRGIV